MQVCNKLDNLLITFCVLFDYLLLPLRVLCCEENNSDDERNAGDNMCDQQASPGKGHV